MISACYNSLKCWWAYWKVCKEDLLPCLQVNCLLPKLISVRWKLSRWKTLLQAIHLMFNFQVQQRLFDQCRSSREWCRLWLYCYAWCWSSPAKWKIKLLFSCWWTISYRSSRLTPAVSLPNFHWRNPSHNQKTLCSGKYQLVWINVELFVYIFKPVKGTIVHSIVCKLLQCSWGIVFYGDV